MILAVAVLALVPPQVQKTLVIDDFTAGPWSWTLFQNQSIDHIWLGLDNRHCLFGNRTVFLNINYNPNNTTLTFSLGNHEHKLASPLQVAWHENGLAYGNDAPSDVNLSAVESFMVDLYAVGGSYIPDSMTLTVRDSGFRYSTAGWNIRPGGVYFSKANFSLAIDWRHITYMSLRMDFHSLPNPTTVVVTNFYATLKPRLGGPGSEVFPTGVGG